MQSKICSTCNQEKPVGEFFKGERYKDGYRGQCKSCSMQKAKEYAKTDKGRSITRAASKQWRVNNPDKRKEYVEQYYKGKGKDYHHQYYQTSHGKQVRNDATKRYHKTSKGKQAEANYKQRNPEKRKAKQAVNNAIVSGNLPRISTQQCEFCGRQAEQYHHWSYLPEHWLDVIPLCRQCHTNVHRNRQDTH